MDRIQSILFLARSSGDLGTPFTTTLWLAKKIAAPIKILLNSQLRSMQSMITKKAEDSRAPIDSPLIESFSGNAISEIFVYSSHHRKSILALATQECIGPTDQCLDTDSIAFIENVQMPVLLFPCHFRSQLPWPSVLVPLSGDIHENVALEVSIGLANQLRVPIDILHVSEPMEHTKQPHEILSRFSDEAHHELSPMIDELLAEASPFSTHHDKRIIRSFRLLRGNAQAKILQEVQQARVGITAVEWKGCFMKGHAEILKAILAAVEAPVILIKQERKTGFHLKAGHQLAS